MKRHCSLHVCIPGEQSLRIIAYVSGAFNEKLHVRVLSRMPRPGSIEPNQSAILVGAPIKSVEGYSFSENAILNQIGIITIITDALILMLRVVGRRVGDQRTIGIEPVGRVQQDSDHYEKGAPVHIVSTHVIRASLLGSVNVVGMRSDGCVVHACVSPSTRGNTIWRPVGVLGHSVTLAMQHDASWYRATRAHDSAKSVEDQSAASLGINGLDHWLVQPSDHDFDGLAVCVAAELEETTSTTAGSGPTSSVAKTPGSRSRQVRSHCLAIPGSDTHAASPNVSNPTSRHGSLMSIRNIDSILLRKVPPVDVSLRAEVAQEEAVIQLQHRKHADWDRLAALLRLRRGTAAPRATVPSIEDELRSTTSIRFTDCQPYGLHVLPWCSRSNALTFLGRTRSALFAFRLPANVINDCATVHDLPTVLIDGMFHPARPSWSLSGAGADGREHGGVIPSLRDAKALEVLREGGLSAYVQHGNNIKARLKQFKASVPDGRKYQALGIESKAVGTDSCGSKLDFGHGTILGMPPSKEDIAKYEQARSMWDAGGQQGAAPTPPTGYTRHSGEDGQIGQGAATSAWATDGQSEQSNDGLLGVFGGDEIDQDEGQANEAEDSGKVSAFAAQSRQTPAASANVGSNAGSRASRDIVGGTIQPIQLDGGYSEYFSDASPMVCESTEGGSFRMYASAMAVTSSDVRLYDLTALPAFLDTAGEQHGFCVTLPTKAKESIAHKCPACPPSIVGSFEQFTGSKLASSIAVLSSRPSQIVLTIGITGLGPSMQQGRSLFDENSVEVSSMASAWQNAFAMGAQRIPNSKRQRRIHRRRIPNSHQLPAPRPGLQNVHMQVLGRVLVPRHNKVLVCTSPFTKGEPSKPQHEVVSAGWFGVALFSHSELSDEIVRANPADGAKCKWLKVPISVGGELSILPEKIQWFAEDDAPALTIPGTSALERSGLRLQTGPDDEALHALALGTTPSMLPSLLKSYSIARQTASAATIMDAGYTTCRHSVRDVLAERRQAVQQMLPQQGIRRVTAIAQLESGQAPNGSSVSGRRVALLGPSRSEVPGNASATVFSNWSLREPKIRTWPSKSGKVAIKQAHQEFARQSDGQPIAIAESIRKAWLEAEILNASQWVLKPGSDSHPTAVHPEDMQRIAPPNRVRADASSASVLSMPPPPLPALHEGQAANRHDLDWAEFWMESKDEDTTNRQTLDWKLLARQEEQLLHAAKHRAARASGSAAPKIRSDLAMKIEHDRLQQAMAAKYRTLERPAAADFEQLRREWVQGQAASRRRLRAAGSVQPMGLAAVLSQSELDAAMDEWVIPGQKQGQGQEGAAQKRGRHDGGHSSALPRSSFAASGASVGSQQQSSLEDDFLLSLSQGLQHSLDQ